MANVTLPYSMEQDRINQVKANSVHVDSNFNTLLEAVNNKLDKDGTTVATADLPMGNHKVVGLATPENSGDATTKGYVDALITELRASIAEAKQSIETNLQNLQSIYPVGSIYIGTQSECPMETLIPDSEWRLVSSGNALWTGDGSNGNTTIKAGLPNITGAFGVYGQVRVICNTEGAFYQNNESTYGGTDSGWGSGTGNRGLGRFDASRSSSIYGNSTTVQPPAYVVNVWRRTA